MMRISKIVRLVVPAVIALVLLFAATPKSTSASCGWYCPYPSYPPYGYYPSYWYYPPYPYYAPHYYYPSYPRYYYPYRPSYSYSFSYTGPSFSYTGPSFSYSFGWGP